jgi:hypothetical protein
VGLRIYPNQPIAINAVKESSSQSWQVDLQCPQCGAPLVIEETDRILACSFCRVRLYLALQSPFRYYLPPPKKPLEDLFFAPYWRFKGMVFSLERTGVTERFVDSSLLALHSQPFPISLGVRPQVLRLRHLTPGIEGAIILPEMPFQGYPLLPESAPQARSSAAGGRGSSTKAFIGELVSLIYAPFHVREGVLFDAVLESPLTHFAGNLPGGLPLEQELPGQIRFVPMLCPSCGWDLEGEKNALVLLCRNCHSAWQASAGDNFEQVAFAFTSIIDDGSLYLPFWRIRAEISGVSLRSYADLVRLANLPKAIQSHWEEDPLAFWIPAFKIQPQLFLRLARSFTTAQLPQDTQETIPRAPLHPVSLPLSEAIESIKVLLASLAVKRELLLAKLSEILINIEEQNLVYVPFALKGSELIQSAMQVSVNANALNWGKLL